MLLAMGVDWNAIESSFFVEDSLLDEKIAKIQEYFVKSRGLWNGRK